MSDITSNLIIIGSTTTKPETVSTEAAKEIRDQTEKVLAKHRHDLPREIVTQLTSPRPTIISMGLREVSIWLSQHNAKLKDEYCRAHPRYEEACKLVSRAQRLLGSKYKEQIVAKISSRNLRMLKTTDLYDILESNMVDRMKLAVEQAGNIYDAERRDDPTATKPEPPVHKASKPKREEPIRHQIIVVGKRSRERQPKQPKPVYTGLPPVRTDNTDTSFVDAKPYATVEAGKYQGGPNPRGVTIPKSEKQKRGKGGGVKTRPGRKN